MDRVTGSGEGKDFVFEKREGISIIRLSRQLPLDELLSVVEEVAALGVTDARLWDIGDFFAYSPEEVKLIADLGRRLWPGKARVAYLATGKVFFGLLRMFEVYREQEGYSTRAFYEETEAIQWLLASGSQA